MQLGHPIVISASHVCFDVMTWNIEHHGFTSNTVSGAKSWTQTKNAAKSGYNESENELITRLTNVFRVIVDDSGRHSNSSMPGLMGFNEIGILAFDKMKTLIPGIITSSSYQSLMCALMSPTTTDNSSKRR